MGGNHRCAVVLRVAGAVDLHENKCLHMTIKVGPLFMSGSGATRRLLTLVTVGGLGVDGYVHWQLAPLFDTLTGSASPHISQGELFRLESVMALIAMVLVLLTRHRVGAVVALLIAAGGLGAVLMYGYIDVGGFGPLPDMYDPTWYPEKTISAFAEAVAALGALCLTFLPSVTSKADR
jgi:hypothetical protein